MFQRGLIFAVFLAGAVITYLHGQELLLAFYVLFPLLVFPVFYFFYGGPFLLFVISALLSAALYGVFILHHPSPEMLLLGMQPLAVFGAILFYQKKWRRAYERVRLQDQTLSRELEALEQKHASRLQSLHHLERQVSSLMNLFEIARDFSESLSLDTLAGLLQKKVLPELPFERMQLISFPSERGEAKSALFFKITSAGIEEGSPDLREQEAADLQRVRQSRRTEKCNGTWIFPLVIEGKADDILSVTGADPNDIAKFEVLVSHLVLQVKKIKLYEAVKELSIVDGLTGVFVRRHFLERFEEELKRCIKYNLPLAVLMLDIDHFKRYNDAFGHPVGDATLREVASLLVSSLRRVDMVARYGGEEFVVVIPETRKEGAAEVAERIRSQIAKHRFNIYDEQTHVTVSIGIALFPDDASLQYRSEFHRNLVDELIQHSDKALYRGKEEGRNRVVLYQEL